jgi:photosystem II stability/assembly factor-like uncharacterized protein
MNKSFRLRFGLLQACFLAFLFFGLAQVGLGQGDYWEELKTPEGGNDFKMYKSKNGWLFVTHPTDKGTLQVKSSNDDGENWSEVILPTGTKNFVSGGNGTLFCDNDTITYKSLDKGLTWQLISLNYKQFCEDREGNYYALKDTSIYYPSYGTYQKKFIVRSIDQGVNWTNELSPASGSPVDSDAYLRLRNDNSGNIIYDGINYYTGYTFNNGLTWKINTTGLLFSSPIISPISGTAFDFYFDRFKRTPLNSNISQDIVFDSLTPNIYYSNFLFMPNGRIYIVTTVGYYYSDDDGVTWTIYENKKLFGGFILEVPAESNSIFVGGGNIFKSEDNLQTFKQSKTGINSARIFEFQTSKDSIWYAITVAGLWKTKDKTEHWELIKLAPSGHDVRSGQQFTLIANDSILIQARDTLFLSINKGISFENISPPQGCDSKNFGIGVSNISNTIFVNTPQGLSKSNNLGLSWTLSSENKFLFKMITHPSGILFAILDSLILDVPSNSYTKESVLYKSIDDGQTWVKASSLNYPNELACNELGEIFMSANYNVYRSKNLGLNWKKIASGYPYELIFNSRGNLFQRTNDFTLKNSVNNGVTWQSIPDLPPTMEFYPTVSPQNLFIDEDQKLIVPSSGYRVDKLYQSNSTLQGAYLHGNLHRDLDANCDTPEASDSLANWIVQADGENTWLTNSDSAGN